MILKLDHFVINIDRKYQTDNRIIEKIRKVGFPYEPKWGKGTKGFKASNIWVGNEYFEMINLLKPNGGGWKKDWVEQYNNGHRGLICLMIDTDDINSLYEKMRSKDISITKPQYLQFKWFFNLFTRTMPWKNSYLNFFEGAPLQIGFQQMKDDKARDFMRQYMVPNSKDNGITEIQEVIIKANFTKTDIELLHKIFEVEANNNNRIEVELSNGGRVIFKKAQDYNVIVKAHTENQNFIGNALKIENIDIEVH